MTFIEGVGYNTHTHALLIGIWPSVSHVEGVMFETNVSAKATCQSFITLLVPKGMLQSIYLRIILSLVKCWGRPNISPCTCSTYQ